MNDDHCSTRLMRSGTCLYCCRDVRCSNSFKTRGGPGAQPGSAHGNTLQPIRRDPDPEPGVRITLATSVGDPSEHATQWKRCTMEWACGQAQSALHVPRQKSYSQHKLQYRLSCETDEPVDGTGFRLWDDLIEPSPTQDPMTWNPTNDLAPSLFDYDPMLLNSMINDNGNSEDVQPGEHDAVASAQSRTDLQLSELSNASEVFIQQPSDLEPDILDHQRMPASYVSQASRAYGSFQSTSSKSPRRLSGSTWTSLDKQPVRFDSPLSSLSPFSVDQQMITASNRQATSSNLLRIYHDVLEHNLSCWLSELTCPYRPRSGNTTHVEPEWGSSWSNRIYQRTIKLDRVAQSCKLVDLTPSEDQAASKALHLAVMAFATQWAQGSHRHREKFPAKSPDHGVDELTDGIADEFDRTLQHNIWDQAQRALQRVAEVESYRVACAELIFGLTQKPRTPKSRFCGYDREENGPKFAMDSILSQLQKIIREEGPPVYMERAARKMHVLKHRCDSFEKGLGKPCWNPEEDLHGISTMCPEDRVTVGLLYWLAIMFDTVSSSMNERPIVVLDQDCEHDRQKEIQLVGNRDRSLRQSRWDLDLFLQGSPEEVHQAHWPCSYEVAAENVTKSAPIKVLLFRHLSYLQNAVRQSAHAEQIEDIIRSMTSLYEYWNKTHGAFFGELVQNYTAVPHRIQGWFVCISAHWHLAALMLADLLDFIDENSLGMSDASSHRIATQMARRIRKRSAGEVSDLARVGTPPTRYADLAVPQMLGFHPAVNEGTLLTEPWTMILIRGFTKACMIFVVEADQSLRTAFGQNSHDFERNMEQAEYCMKGLWLLGKKSDMAREIAETLSHALNKLWEECVVSSIPPELV
ncbi:regulatory protein alcR (C6 zinc finger domain-containing protein) [Seiridium cupressi]